MFLSLCLYVCCKHRPLYQNQIFKIPITLQHPSSTKFKDGRACWPHLWRSTCGYTHTHIRRPQCSNCIIPISCWFVVDLVATISVCSRRASWLQLVQRKCADAKTTRSLVVIKVDRSASSQYCASAFSAVFSTFLKPFCGKTLVVVLLFCCCLFCITLLSQ